MVLVCFSRTASHGEYFGIVSLFGLSASDLLQVLLTTSLNTFCVPGLWLSGIKPGLARTNTFCGSCCCWKCTAEKLKRAGIQKYYQKSGFSRHYRDPFVLLHAPSGIICREVDLSVTDHGEYLECCALQKKGLMRFLQKY